jgi:hypothetical protein
MGRATLRLMAGDAIVFTATDRLLSYETAWAP